MASARDMRKADRQLLMENKRKQDERFTYRVLITFGLTGGLLFYARYLSQQTETSPAAGDLIRTALLWTAAATALCVVLALATHFWARVRVLTVCFAAAAAAGVMMLLSTLFIWRFADNQLPLTIILAVGALLYLLYYIYPREFSLLMLIDCGGALGLWMMQRVLQSGSYGWIYRYRVWPGRATLPLIGFVLALGLAVAALLLLRARKGRVGQRCLLPPDTRYGLLFTTCGLLALGLTACIVFGWTAAWASIIAAFSYLFIAAIYYTSKLM